MNTQHLEAVKEKSPLDELLTLPLRGENPYLQEWMANGNKVFGYVCSYTPEEIIYACQGAARTRILPVRIGGAGCTTTEDSDTYLTRYLCSFARSSLQLGLNGEYDYLDGVVFSSCCEQMRRSYEFWRDKIGLDFLEMIHVPRSTRGETQYQWYYDEIVKLYEHIGSRFGMVFSQDSLKESIKIYNKYRSLMRELYNLRLGDAPKLTGTEAMKITQAGFNMPKPVFNQKLEAALEELKARPGITDFRAKVLITGSYIDDPGLIELIENEGALVVADALCSGRKYFEDMVDESLDPVDALAKRYLSKKACPRMMDGLQERVEFTKTLAKEANVDGAILEFITFCDIHNIENMIESRELKKDDIPTMLLEREYLPADTGRLKTRVQAFIEKISG